MSRLRIFSVTSRHCRHDIAYRIILSSLSRPRNGRYGETPCRGIVVPPPRAPVPDQPFEEETLPDYAHGLYYPVYIGERLNSRYDVIGKLGDGAYSTVWLCRDLETDDFVSVKVSVCAATCPDMTKREEAVYELLADFTTAHRGALQIRDALDRFYIHQRSGNKHLCLVYKPLHSTVLGLQRLGGKRQPLPEELVKHVLCSLLEALDFLHSECNITHCDIQLSNLMLSTEDNSVFSAYLEDEKISPAPKKTIDAHRAIYASRRLRFPGALGFGEPMLCDFGEARVGTTFPPITIQPNIYRAPEVLLGLDWDKGVDIWNVACVVSKSAPPGLIRILTTPRAWDLVQAEHLFNGEDEKGHHNNRVHLGEIIGFSGIHPWTSWLDPLIPGVSSIKRVDGTPNHPCRPTHWKLEPRTFQRTANQNLWLF